VRRVYDTEGVGGGALWDTQNREKNQTNLLKGEAEEEYRELLLSKRFHEHELSAAMRGRGVGNDLGGQRVGSDLLRKKGEYKKKKQGFNLWVRVRDDISKSSE